ncbi:MAG TPA: glycosyltransferase family 4 protein [Acidobacteriaceae bacterium]|nr:glycosyltransferase family 4 protein [Acidobacteriaceae bacterium]
MSPALHTWEGNDSSRGDREQGGVRIGFLLSRYPAVSHTFFLKEVLGLRERGIAVPVASINPPDRAVKALPEVEAGEAAATYYVKSGGMAKMAVGAVGAALRHPGAALRGLRAALSLGGLGLGWFDLRARVFALFYLAEALLVGRWMRTNGIEHLHVHFGGAVATVGMLTAEAWGVPWSVTLHGPDEFFDQDEFYLRQKIESARFVICISDFCRSQVLRIVPSLAPERTEVVRLGVDCSALLPVDKTRDGQTIRIACTGRMVAAKGHRILLEALALASGELAAQGILLECVLIGDGPERAGLEGLAQRLGIAEVVRFAGAQAHGVTLGMVAEADLFVLASFAEGLPVALMEAMALGIPCISTQIAAIGELIHDGENGLLVPASNVAMLAAGLARLAEDGEYRRRLGAEARRTVEGEYNLASNLDRLAALWRSKGKFEGAG